MLDTSVWWCLNTWFSTELSNAPLFTLQGDTYSFCLCIFFHPYFVLPFNFPLSFGYSLLDSFFNNSSGTSLMWSLPVTVLDNGHVSHHCVHCNICVLKLLIIPVLLERIFEHQTWLTLINLSVSLLAFHYWNKQVPTALFKWHLSCSSVEHNLLNIIKNSFKWLTKITWSKWGKRWPQMASKWVWISFLLMF